MTIFGTWQLRVTLDSIRNSCDVLFVYLSDFTSCFTNLATENCPISISKTIWIQHCYMVSYVVEIAIYNLDLFHSTLLSISTTRLLNKPLLTGNCACSKSRTSVSCKSLARGQTLPWFLWQLDGCLSSDWRFSTKLSLTLNFPAPPGNLAFAIWSCLGQGFSEEPCEHAIVLNMIV